MIVVDGNDGTGKTTLCETLRSMGYRVADRGAPTEMTRDARGMVHGEGRVDDADDYVILDASPEVSRERLRRAGKDLSEEFHTLESLTHYREEFRQVANNLGVALVRVSGTPDEAWAELNRSWFGVPKTRTERPIVVVPTGRLFASVRRMLERTFNECVEDPFLNRRMSLGTMGGVDLIAVKHSAVRRLVAQGVVVGGFCGTENDGATELVTRAAQDPETKIRVCALSDDPKVLDHKRKVLTIASQFPELARKFATKHDLRCAIINTGGASEGWVPRLADVIVDVVETGSSARANGLHVVAEVATLSCGFYTGVQSLFRHHEFYERVCQAWK